LVNNKRLTVFVTLESGATFTLVLQTDAAMSASSIRLMERRESASAMTTPLARPESPPAAQRSISYETAIHELMMAAATGRLDQGMEASSKAQDFTLWVGTRFVLQRSISSLDMVVDVFSLTNLTQQPMRVIEQELYRQSVLAVAIESHLLNPGDSTTVYIVRAMEQ
jgi:TraK protein